MCAGQPLEADAIGLAQQQLCLQKFEILHQAWSESTRLGQTVRVPYLANHLTVQPHPACLTQPPQHVALPPVTV